MKRGFTIVELLIVIAILGALTVISAFSYTQVYKRANDGEKKSLISLVRAGAEKYYATNNEYPLATAVHGAALTGSPPASYATASSVLNVSLTALKDSKVKLVACGATQTACKTNNLSTEQVYYYTKSTQASTAAEVITTVAAGSDCAFTFPASETGALAYLIAYIQDNQLRVITSNNGTVQTSDNFWCAFTTAP